MKTQWTIILPVLAGITATNRVFAQWKQAQAPNDTPTDGASPSLSMGLSSSESPNGQTRWGIQLGLALPLDLVPDKASSLPLTHKSASTTPLRSRLARDCVRAAWQAAGLGDLSAVDRIQSRARTAALLPETRLRYAQEWDQSFRFAPTTQDPYRLQESNGGGRTFEARLSWRLDRLIFAQDELAAENIRLRQVQARAQITGEVLKALFTWRKSRAILDDPASSSETIADAWVQLHHAHATLDVLTNGWFSTHLNVQ